MVEAVLDGTVLPLRGRRQQLLLTTLLLDANRVVPLPQLIEGLWSDRPPARPEHALHTYVFRLRNALGPAADLIQTAPGGYRIEIAPGQLDLADFRDLVEQAAAEPDQPRRVELLTEALARWRDVPQPRTAAEAVLCGQPWLVEERLRATESLIDARLALGEYDQLIPELRTQTEANPLRERFWAQLMLALDGAGRATEAVQVYRELAHLLAEELGVDPGTEIRRVFKAIEAGEGPGEVQDEPADGWRRHALLPAPAQEFVGRAETTDQLTGYLTDAARLPVAIVSGTPGVGKSALAVQLGHQLRASFPDGQWHLRLDGAGRSPRDPFDVLGDLLGLAGVEPGSHPADLDGRSALLRTRLAGRRVLLVLDDARDTQQVRPLLPGTAGCAVIVTSRAELTGLSVAVGARLTRLSLFASSEATDLLAELLGSERIAADPAGARKLVELCGGLPLALRIAAGQLASRPTVSLTDFATELATGDRLGRLAIGDGPDTAVAVAFGLSYESLPESARRMFALLGAIPGNDVSVPAAAALLDRPAHEAGNSLEVLAAANLLQRERSRYRMHDLIRLYAAGRAEVEPGADEAWARLASWYLRTADAAAELAYKPHIRFTPRIHGENQFANESQATNWVETEEQNLVAVVEKAADTGLSATAWQLADVLRHYLAITDRVAPWRRLVDAGMRAAAAEGNNGAEGAMWHSLGVMHYTIGDVSAALNAITAAISCYAKAGFRLGQAATLCNLGMVYDDMGESRAAAEVLSAGIKIFREEGLSATLAPALHSLSEVYFNLGELEAAVASADDAIEVAPSGQPLHVALINRGTAYRLQGRFTEAEADLTAALEGSERPSLSVYYEVALLFVDLGRLEEAEAAAHAGLEICRRDGLEWHEAVTLAALGSVAVARGNWAEAAGLYAEAREIAVRRQHHATEAKTLAGLAAAALGSGDAPKAWTLAEQARQVAESMHQRILECDALWLLSVAAERSGDETGAERCARQAKEIERATGYRPVRRLLRK